MNFEIILIVFASYFFYTQAEKNQLADINNPELWRNNGNNGMEIEDMGTRIACTYWTCFKRSTGQDELGMGPFWANRGKRNRQYHNSDPLETPQLPQDRITIYRTRGYDTKMPILPTSSNLDPTNLWKILNDITTRDRRVSNLIDVDTPFFASRG